MDQIRVGTLMYFTFTNSNFKSLLRVQFNVLPLNLLA